MVGHYCGTFREDWLTIPATGRPVYIRYGEVHEVRDGRIVQSNCLWDILDVIRQAGFWPLAPSLGTEGMWPGPITGDGLVFTEADPEQSGGEPRGRPWRCTRRSATTTTRGRRRARGPARRCRRRITGTRA